MVHPHFGIPKKRGIENKGVNTKKHWNFHIYFDHPKKGVSNGLHNKKCSTTQKRGYRKYIANTVDNVDNVNNLNKWYNFTSTQ